MLSKNWFYEKNAVQNTAKLKYCFVSYIPLTKFFGKPVQIPIVSTAQPLQYLKVSFLSCIFTFGKAN